MAHHPHLVHFSVALGRVLKHHDHTDNTTSLNPYLKKFTCWIFLEAYFFVRGPHHLSAL